MAAGGGQSLKDRYYCSVYISYAWMVADTRLEIARSGRSTSITVIFPPSLPAVMHACKPTLHVLTTLLLYSIYSRVPARQAYMHVDAVNRYNVIMIGSYRIT